MQTYHEATDYLGTKTDRPLSGRATRIQRRPDGSIAVKYQGTDVVTYRADGTIQLRNDGFFTMTTKDRINTYTRANVSQTRGIWYVGRAWLGEPVSLFYDGMIIREATGEPLEPRRPDETEKYKRQLDRIVSKYVTGYAAAAAAGEIAEPNTGDCFYCQLELGRYDGRTTPADRPIPVDHILSHFAEGYYVPSLYAIACYWRRYGSGPGIGWHMGITQKDGAWVRRELGAYLRSIKPQLLKELEAGWTPERAGIEQA